MDLSFLEMVVVGVIAFLVFGPEELIKQAARAGQFVGRMKSQVNNFRIMAEEELLRKELLEDLNRVIEVPSGTTSSGSAAATGVEAAPANDSLENDIEKSIILIDKPK